MSDDEPDRITERASHILGLMANTACDVCKLDNLVLVAQVRGHTIAIAAHADDVQKAHIEMLVDGALTLAEAEMSFTGAAVYVSGLVVDWTRARIVDEVQSDAAVKTAIDTTDGIIKGLQK